MTGLLDSLIGATVVFAETVHDYVQVSFDGERILTIFNEIEASDELPRTLQKLVGAQVARVEERQAKLHFWFDNAIELTVKMNDDAFRGPEAMHLVRPGQPMVIW